MSFLHHGYGGLSKPAGELEGINTPPERAESQGAYPPPAQCEPEKPSQVGLEPIQPPYRTRMGEPICPHCGRVRCVCRIDSDR